MLKKQKEQKYKPKKTGNKTKILKTKAVKAKNTMSC